LLRHQHHTHHHHHHHQLVIMLTSWTTHLVPLPWKTSSSLLLLQTLQTHCYLNQSCKHVSSNHFKTSLNPWKNFPFLKDRILEFLAKSKRQKDVHTHNLINFGKWMKMKWSHIQQCSDWATCFWHPSRWWRGKTRCNIWDRMTGDVVSVLWRRRRLLLQQ
jgi:hypothetical protein